MKTPRPAVAADLPALVALAALFPGDRLSARSLRRLLRSPSACMLVVDGVDGLAGASVLLTRVGSRVGRIYSLVVAPGARGRGLARTLVATLEQEARRRGCVRMRLEVRADNAAARALYAALGYVERTRLPGYYEDGGEGLRLERELAP